MLWDVLDIWRQPADNGRSIESLVTEIHAKRDRYRVSCLIGATQAMADDIGGIYLPHHSRPGLTPATVRERIEVVAYEGTVKYLGQWKAAIELVCRPIGVRFVADPEVNLREADVIVALRDAQWDGALCRRWKSGVKLVNAIAAGRPVLAQRGAAFTEVDPFGHLFADDTTDVEQIALAFRMMDMRQRQAAAEHNARRADAFTLDAIARRYRSVLASVYKEAA